MLLGLLNWAIFAFAERFSELQKLIFQGNTATFVRLELGPEAVYLCRWKVSIRLSADIVDYKVRVIFNAVPGSTSVCESTDLCFDLCYGL